MAQTECVICTEKVLKFGEVPAVLCCGHLFHESCIRTWFKTGREKKCPHCKQGQQQATSRIKDGIIKLYVDSSGPSPLKGVGGGVDSFDLTGDDQAGSSTDSASSEEVLLLRHNLLYAKRGLDDKQREVESTKLEIFRLREMQKAEAEKSKSLWTQLQATVSSARQGETDVRTRDTEIRELRLKMASEQEELRRARTLQGTFDAHALDQEVRLATHWRPASTLLVL